MVLYKQKGHCSQMSHFREPFDPQSIVENTKNANRIDVLKRGIEADRPKGIESQTNPNIVSFGLLFHSVHEWIVEWIDSTSLFL